MAYLNTNWDKAFLFQEDIRPCGTEYATNLPMIFSWTQEWGQAESSDYEQTCIVIPPPKVAWEYGS